MMNIHLKIWSLVILNALAAGTAYGQLPADTTSSNEFLFGFSNSYFGGYCLRLYIHAQESLATFSITTIDGNFEYNGTCSPLNPAVVDIPSSYEIRGYGFAWRKKSLRVFSNQKLSVMAWSSYYCDYYYYYYYYWIASSALVHPSCNVSPDSDISLYTYYAVSTEPITQSQFLIISCQDNSKITIIPSQNITIPLDAQSPNDSVRTLAAGESHSVVLHSMQTLLVNAPFDLTSSKIISNKPLSVISGVELAYFPSDAFDYNFLMTQVPPTVQWGRRFLLSPHKGRSAQAYKILANADGTFIVTTCNESAVTNHMLNADQSVVSFTRGDTYCSVVSSEPIYMAQFGVGGSYDNDNNGDPTLSTIPPVEQHVNFVQFTAIQTGGEQENYYSIVIQNDDLFNQSIVLDGKLQVISSWNTIYDSDGIIVGYGYTSEDFSGTHTVAHPDSNGVLSVMVYGWSYFGGYSYTAGSSVKAINRPATDVAQISPTHGNILGGTLMIIQPLNLLPSSNATCVFDSIVVVGRRVSNSEALCVSPRLPRAGPVKLTVLIDGNLVSTKDKIFYSRHYSDLAEVYVIEDNLVVNLQQIIELNWDTSSLIPSVDESLKLDIVMHEAMISYDSRVEWTNQIQLASGVDNSGVAQIRLPGRERLPLSRAPSNTSYLIVLFQISVNVSSTLGSGNAYYDALQQLRNEQPNAAKTGIWSHVFFRRFKRERETDSCTNWASTDTNHPTTFEGVQSCPCTQRQADLPMSTFSPRSTPGKVKLDRFFHGGNSVCYEPRRTIVDLINGIFKLSQECCYNSDGNLIVGGSRAGSADTQPPNEWENHFIFDLDPFISCCAGSGTTEADIEKYYRRRPSDDCSDFQQLDPPARARGDPHLLTLDGYQYTFNGKGEFILINSVNDLFQLQGRMVSAQGSNDRDSPGTVFSAIAAKQDDSDTIEMQVGNEHPILLVNGVQVELNDESYSNVSVRNISGTYAIAFSSGAYIEVGQTNGFLSRLVISLPRSYYGLTTGLLGVYNGNSSDDLLPNNGSIPLPLNSTIDVIHSHFGITWIIANRSKSLFTYESENSFESFYEPEFTPEFDPVFTNPALEEEANELCNGDSMCLFDIAVTGRTEIGMDTLQQQEEINEIIEIVNTPVVCNPPCVNGICVANETCICHFGYTGDQCDMEDVCLYDLRPVPCENAVAGWIYNTDSGKCEFGGCRERGNVFTSMAECVNNCGDCTERGDSTQCGLRNACEFSKCRAFPQATCEVDACDPCTAHFISGVREVTSQCDDLRCGNGNFMPVISPTDCLIHPCEVMHCPNFPNAVCLPDYCNGCNARFYTEVGVDITDQCSTCPPEKPDFLCPYNPCEFRICANIPDATCVFDSCGQCKARFFVNDGEVEVTEQCESCPIQGQVFKSCASMCQKTCATLQETLICSQQCEPGCTCPDDMVLDEASNQCVLPEDCPCPGCDPVPENCSSVTNQTVGNCSCLICTDCPDGQIFQECKSCPATCLERLNSALVCPDECSSGCQCPDGEVYDETASKCVRIAECPEPDHCTLPSVTGPCRGNIRRYFYNLETEKCEAFRYGGCMGNENNFFSLHDCEISCSALPPSCSPSFCATKRTDVCTLHHDSSSQSNSNCPDYVVSNCQACYYSPEPLNNDEDPSCVRDCVTDEGEYDSECLKEWGRCIRGVFGSEFHSIPLKERVPENYNCFEYECEE